MLTLDNSVVRVSKKSKTVNSITEIEQWTTVFTTYMSIFAQKFPRRSQELLQYMILIRYATRVHKGLGWAIYDYKFRQKASKNHTCVWSDVDRQLWRHPMYLKRRSHFCQRTPAKQRLDRGRTTGHMSCVQRRRSVQ